jgi:phage-related protein
MSVALGTDLNSAAIQVGKALQDPTIGLTALRRVGVSFTDQQSEMITRLFESGNALRAQKLILQELTTEFGGSAEAQATATAKMGVAFSNLAEVIGGLVAPVFQFLAEEIHGLIKFFQAEVGPAFEKVMDWLRGVWEAVQPVAEAFGRELTEALSQTWHVIRDRVWPALKDLWEALQPLLKIVGQVIAVVLKLALEALPIVVGAISVIVKALAIWHDALATIVSFVVNKFVEPIVRALQKVIEWVTKAAEWVADKFGAAWEAIEGPVLAVINTIGGAIRTMVGWIQDAIEALGRLAELAPGVGGQATNEAIRNVLPPGALPEAQTGGWVARSGVAVIHRGEQIVPADQVGRGGDIVLQINGQTFARIIRDELNKLAGRNAGSGLR